MALTQVNSGGIEDGSIVNADIKSDAAIAPSKIDAANFAGIGSSGHIEFKNETSARFFEASGNGTNKVSLKAPATLAADYTITLPVDDGSADQFLKTNGSGTTSWSDVPAGGISDVVSDTSPQLGGDLETNGHNILLGDSSNGADDDVIRIGAGQDLNLYHDGTNSWIVNKTGYLTIGAKHGENGAIIKPDAGVELYYDNIKTIETVSNGITVQGAEAADGILNIFADDGDDNADKWRWTTSTNGSIYLQGYASGGWDHSLRAIGEGAVEFYHNGTKKFETDASAMTIHGGITYEASGTDWKIQCGTGVSSNIYINAVKDESSIFIERNQGVSLYHNGTSKCFTGSNGLWLYDRVVPSNDDTYDLGGGSNRWDDVYATNTTIQTSDRNAKDNITASDLGLAFINKLTPVSYKWKGKTRTHYGLVAQDVETVLSDIGKSTTQFAGYIKSDNPKEYYTSLAETEGTDKNIGDVKKEASTTYGLRYGEFIGPLIKAVQELSAEVETLKTKVSALEAK